MSKIILITGASSGFGKAIAEKFAAGGWNLILTARRKEKLEAVATAIEQKYKVKTLSLIFDVQNKEAVFQQIGSLPTEWQAIDLLVNNAGLALGRDSFENANIEDWETMIDTNVKGLLYTSKATLPYLIKNQGHIINIGSTAGKEVYKDGNVYCATKHAVDAISKAQRIDLLVNNAGLALGRDSFENANIEDWETMIDTNVKGLLYTSKASLPYLIKNQGHIINIGSTAAKEVYKDGNVYCATKHAVDAISKAQRIDLLQYKIKVTAIHPGAVETDFSLIRFKGDAAKAAAVYAGYEPLKAEDIADTTWYVANVPKHVCINDLVMTCVAQGNSFTIQKDA